jgi:excisionase family DNA binding protein
VEIVGLAEFLVEAVRAEVDRALDGRPQGWLDSKRAADYLSTTPEVIRDLVRRNGLPHHRAPGTARLLFRPTELDRWVEADEPLLDGDRRWTYPASVN